MSPLLTPCIVSKKFLLPSEAKKQIIGLSASENSIYEIISPPIIFRSYVALYKTEIEIITPISIEMGPSWHHIDVTKVCIAVNETYFE